MGYYDSYDHARGFLFSRITSPQEIGSRYLTLSSATRLSAFLN
jgi:hypothetical protein